MFCTKCGHKNPDDAIFCDGCGNRLEEESVDGSSVENEVVEPAVSSNASVAQKGSKKKLDKNGRIGLVVIFALVLIGLILFKKPSYTFNHYFDISVNGFDGYGYVTTHTLSDEFYDACKDRIKPTPSGKKLASQYEGKERFVKAIIDNYVDFTIEPVEGLMNGDTVVVKFDIDEKSILKDFGIKLKANDIRMPVTNLQEVNVIDLFKYVTFEVSGTSPNGSLEVKVDDNCPIDDYTVYDLIQIEKEHNLSNGDEIKISMRPMESYEAQNFLDRFDGVPVGKEFTYKVEGLGSYVSVDTDLTDANFEKIDAQMKDELTSMFANKADGNMSANSIDRIGYYVLTPKENVSRDPMIYVVYKVNTSVWIEETGYSDTFDFYTYLKYRDPIYVNAETPIKVDVTDGELPDSICIDCYNEESSYREYYYINGERDLNEMYRECVSSRMDQFVTKSTVQ